MPNLEALLTRLKSAQRAIIHDAAKIPMLPPDGMLRRISDLENTIAAVEALIDEEQVKDRVR